MTRRHVEAAKEEECGHAEGVVMSVSSGSTDDAHEFGVHAFLRSIRDGMPKSRSLGQASSSPRQRPCAGLLPGQADDITAAGWPVFDAAQIDADDADYPVQVNGKMRGKISLSRAVTGPALDQAVLAHPDVVAIIAGRPIKKLVVVPGKIVNLVLG